MEKDTNYGTLAYIKSEELEEEVSKHNDRITHLEMLYGTLPFPDDPDDLEDTPYDPPPPGTIINKGMSTFEPYYYTTIYNSNLAKLHFTAPIDTAVIINIDFELQIISNPNNYSMKVDFLLNNTLLESTTLTPPLYPNYKMPFTTFFNTTSVANMLQIKISAQSQGSCRYKAVAAKFEILGSNVDILNPRFQYGVFYNDDTYYISKCVEGQSSYLIQNTGGVNLNAPYTPHIESGVIWQRFAQGHRYVSGTWQRANIGYFYVLGNGNAHMAIFDNPVKMVTISEAYDCAFIPDLIQTGSYAGQLVYVDSLGGLMYMDVDATFSSGATRKIPINPEHTYVYTTGVEDIRDSFTSYPKRGSFLATRNTGEVVFYSRANTNANNFYTLDLGYGANSSACYRDPEKTIIDIYMRVYDRIVKKTLNLNPSTDRYELDPQAIVMGSWKKYIPGAPPAYFTISKEGKLLHTREPQE